MPFHQSALSYSEFNHGSPRNRQGPTIACSCSHCLVPVSSWPSIVLIRLLGQNWRREKQIAQSKLGSMTNHALRAHGAYATMRAFARGRCRWHEIKRSPPTPCSNEGNSTQGHFQATAQESGEQGTARVTRIVPAWISAMLQSQFFGPCDVHKDLKKNEVGDFFGAKQARPSNTKKLSKRLQIMHH